MQYFIVFIGLFMLSGAASAASYDPPKRKSGLWEVKVSSGQAGGTHTMQQCVDQKTDDLMKNDMEGGAKMSCSKSEFRKEGDKIVHDSICKVEGSSAKTRTVISGRFDSAYKIESKSSYEPPLSGMRESTTVMDARWLGACKAGQKAGDVSMPGMPNINMDELMKKMPKSR
jgi:hypothetical protein